MKSSLTFLLLSAALVLLPKMTAAQSVTIAPIISSHFCAGDPITVTFTVTGFWQHRNAFTLQLSGVDGSFTNFQNLGSLVDTLPGTFTIIDTIPSTVIGSSRYRFRIASALPYKVSADNGSDISIGSAPYSYFKSDLPIAGAVGTPITFTNGDPFLFDTSVWDFGSGAIPATAITGGTYTITVLHDMDKQGHMFTYSDTSVVYSQAVTYSTPGEKTVTLRDVSRAGCWSTPKTYTFHVYDCTYPSIPRNAVVVNADTMVGQMSDHGTYWVNPGVKLISNPSGRDTIFAEAGSTIEGGTLCYMKPGSVLTTPYPYGASMVIYGDGANVQGQIPFTLKCPTLDFDYSSAPPNVAFPLAVRQDLNLATITLSPNPTRGLLQVQGLPAGNTTISVFNLLGETVIARKDIKSSACSMDLSKLPPGLYYMRFASTGSVMTKKIIKD